VNTPAGCSGAQYLAVGEYTRRDVAVQTNTFMPRFAILQHDSPRGLHWDLLLQAGEALKTWALPRPPAANGEMSCDALPDHRLAYLDYEGPVSADRGTVSRWDEGEYETEGQSEAEWVVRLAGRRLVGRAVLTRLSPDAEKWSLRWEVEP
jgi:hypothetical protein